MKPKRRMDMKTTIYPGRYTAEVKDDFVVFIIGMRINKLTAVTKWLPVAQAMGPMIKELYQNPEWGFLHSEYSLGWRLITLTQYWRSFDDLEAYARGERHAEAWKNFSQKIGSDGTVGIFHESYQIKKGQCEALYSNMPKYGLGKAFEQILITKEYQTARKRLKKV